jgi:hypothetical protein
VVGPGILRVLWVDSRPNHKNRPENLKWSDVWVLEILEIMICRNPPTTQQQTLPNRTGPSAFGISQPCCSCTLELVGWDQFFLRGPFKRPNLKPQTLEILGFEKGPECHGSCISLLLLHLEQSQAQHGVVFAQVFGFPGCQAQPCASSSISTTPGLTVGQWATKLLGIRLFDLFWLLREVGMDQYLLIPFLGE